MFSSENRVGRLIELRIRTPLTPEEAREIFQSQMELVRDLDGRFVAVTDLRQAHVFPASFADQLIDLMKVANPRLERSAILISDSAVFGLQAERAVIEAGNPGRRAFRRPSELIAWLGEVLTEPERHRVRRFLDEAGTVG